MLHSEEKDAVSDSWASNSALLIHTGHCDTEIGGFAHFDEPSP